MREKIKEGFCVLLHVLSGFLSSLGGVIHPIYALIGFSGFEIYENLQYLKKDDWACRETREFMAGFFAGIVFIFFCLPIW